MGRAQDGDKAAYAALLTEIVPYLRALAARRLGTDGEIEDAVQEILVAIHAIRHTYDRRRPFRPWLATIASRRVVDLLRRRKHRRRREVELESDAAATVGDDMDPARMAARGGDVLAVRRAVEALPHRQREAVELLRLQELSLAEAAAASGQSQGSLKVACHRALKALRNILTQDR